MIDNGSDELVNGLWTFMKRALIIFLPFWVFLICWTIDLPLFLSSILAGLSLSSIIYFEKKKLNV